MAEEALSKEVVEKYHATQGAEAPEPNPKADVSAEPEKKAAIDIPSFIEPEAKEEKPKPETKQKPKKATPDDDPHAENHVRALREARAETRETKRMVEEERKQRLELQQRLEAMLRANEPPPPTKETDPIAYFDAKTVEQEKELARLKAAEAARTQQAQQVEQYEKFKSFVTKAALPFIESTKDYSDAYKHVMERKRDELLYAGVPEEHVGQQLGVWEANFAAAALKAGKSPSEQLYGLSQVLGYKAKTDQSSADKKIQSIQRGQDAAKTVGSGGGEGELSLSSLEQMSDEQIKAIASDNKKWLKIMGATH